MEDIKIIQMHITELKLRNQLKSGDLEVALTRAMSALEKQISMKPVFVHPLQFDNWILCNERLPETFEPEAKAYLTTNEDGMIGVSYYHHGWSNGYESVFDVIAWQPLPEPYREENKECD